MILFLLTYDKIIYNYFIFYEININMFDITGYALFGGLIVCAYYCYTDFTTNPYHIANPAEEYHIELEEEEVNSMIETVQINKKYIIEDEDDDDDNGSVISDTWDIIEV